MTTHRWVVPQPMSARQHAQYAPTPSTYPCLASPIVRDVIVWAFRVDTRLRISLSEQSGQGGFEGWGLGHREISTPLLELFPGSPRSLRIDCLPEASLALSIASRALDNSRRPLQYQLAPRDSRATETLDKI